MLDFEPEEPVTLDRKILLSSLKSSPRESSPTPGRCTDEHFKVLLEDSNTFDFLIEALNNLAQTAIHKRKVDRHREERRRNAGHREAAHEGF